MDNGEKKTRQVLATLKRGIAEILVTVISTVIAEAVIRLIFS